MNIREVESGMKIMFAQKLRVEVQQTLSGQCLFMANHIELKSYVDEMCRGLVFRLSSYVLANPDGMIDIEEKWPQDWWQAVRERWAPVWWLKRWPVKYKRISVHKECWRVCPHVDIKTDNSPHFAFLARSGE